MTTVRLIQQEDAQALYKLVSENAARLRNYFPNSVKNFISPESAEETVNTYLSLARSNKKFVFVIEDNKKRQIIGVVILKDINHDISLAELGYYIDKNAEGNGIISRSIPFVIEFAFNTHKLNKLFCRVAPDNEGSNRVALKNNFRKEGLLRQEYRIANNNLIDVNYYGLLKEEFKKTIT